jgi:hypothetical protein
MNVQEVDFMYKLKTPQAPLALTTAGLIPFMAGAGAMLVWRDDPQNAQTAGLYVMVFGALVLSFLGGIRWGSEMSRRDKPRFGELLMSIFGVLAGWALVMAYFTWRPDRLLFIGLAVTLLAHFVMDVLTGEFPLWYRRLRVWPTLITIACLVAAFVII